MQVTKASQILRTYDINKRSCLLDVPYFVGGLPHDAMHDILEGIASHHIKRLLFHAIKSTIFAQKDFNEHLVNFNYGYAEKDKPYHS